MKRGLTKKVNVEDILAMRRMEQGAVDSSKEYPGIQPMRLTSSPTQVMKGEWPTYRFGQESEEWHR
jgi:hypothetical protein